jgi:integrase
MPFLTDELIRALPKPVDGKRPPIIWDADADGAPGTSLTGFGLKRTPGGSRTFILNYRNTEGRQRQAVVAHFPASRTEAARSRARKLAEAIDLGGDPVAEKQERRAARKAALTMAELGKRFLEQHVKPRRRPSTVVSYTTILTKHIVPALGSKSAAEITTNDLERLHAALTRAGKPYAANRTIEVASSMLKMAMRWGARPDGVNPARQVERNREHARRRYLSDEELGRLLAALKAHPHRSSAHTIWLSVACGARKGEVMRMRWGDLDLTRGVWSRKADDLKGKRDHDIPLSGPVLALLTQLRDDQLKGRRVLPEFVFSDATLGEARHLTILHRTWRQLRQTADLPGVRIHDLRHSFASFAVSDGATLPMISALLAHRSSATSSRYAHLHDRPLRAVTEKVGARMAAAVRPTPPEPPSSPPAAVVNLPTRRGKART